MTSFCLDNIQSSDQGTTEIELDHYMVILGFASMKFLGQRML